MGSSLYLSKLSDQGRDDLIRDLHQIQGGNCFICGNEIDLALHKDDLDIDHVKPTAMNGKDEPSNFAVTHSSCNRSKQDANLEISRILFRFDKLSVEIQKENRNPNLDDILKMQGGSQYTTSFSIVGDFIKFSLAKVGRNEVIKLPLYTDPLSGFSYFFSTFPIEYVYHDMRINPRSIGKNISQLVTEFYEKRPQLHIALGWIELKGDGNPSPVQVFDGQHKAAAQIMLGVKEIPVRVFVNPNTDVLLTANTNAGTTLRQVAFDKSVQRHLGSTLYVERVKRFKEDLNKPDDDYNFSERDLVKYFKGQAREMKKYILDAVRDWVTHNVDNKMKEYVEFSGKGKDRPLSYSTLEKTFYSLFLFQEVLDTSISLDLEIGNNPRELERTQLLALMNLIAEELFIGKFEPDVSADRIEKRMQDGENLPLDHIMCCRLSREEIMFNWLKHVKAIIQTHFLTNGKAYNQEKLFHFRFDKQLWQNIRNYIRNLADLPVWVNKDLSPTVFGGKRNHDYWETIFETGKSLDGAKVLAEPVSLLKMIQRA